MDTLNLINKDYEVTKELQELIDLSANNEILYIKSGTYIVSSLFIKSNTHIVFEHGAILKATTNESSYPLINTRVAGIEMKWYGAILNIINASCVLIEGEGIIDGSGEYWYHKYWGSDMKHGMREVYDKASLRWACDYDCLRPRNVLIDSSDNVIIKDITSYESGFWNFHVLYSHDCTLSNIKIKSDAINSPSTDGIDIDSSYNILISNVITDCNDDSICIKSGRDSDGIRVNRPCHDIKIVDSIINKGFGITIGSEVSGGIYNIFINNIKYNGTDCGFRIKSQKSRKGYIKNVYLDNLYMNNVKYLFHIFLNWNELYNRCVIPNDYKGEIKDHYKVLCQDVGDLKNTVIDGIYINNVISSIDDDYDGISRVFNIEGFSDSLINNIEFNNMNIKAYEYGFISYATNVKFNNVNISVLKKEDKENDEYDNR